MRYEVARGGETFSVEVEEDGPHTYRVTIDEGEPVVVDAFRTPRTVYSVLIGSRQLEGSVDEREDGTLDVHVGTSAFDFTAVDARRRLLEAVGAAGASGTQTLRAQMPGKIVKVMAREGQEVESDQALLVIEAMKMENEINSPIAGSVTQVGVVEGDAVETDALLVVIEPLEAD